MVDWQRTHEESKLMKKKRKNEYQKKRNILSKEINFRGIMILFHKYI